MSKTVYNFLADSFLFQPDLISGDFGSVSLSELEREIAGYRDHVVNSLNDLEMEISAGDPHLSIYFDTINRSRPTVDLLKECALYFDQAVVDDPLVSLSVPPHELSKTFSTTLGYEPPGLRPADVASAALLMKNLTPMVAAGYLKFYPISLQHEPPAQLPIRYSESLFSEGIPPELRRLFSEHVKVRPLRRSDRGWLYKENDPLVPCRAICVGFEGLQQVFAYHLFPIRQESFDDEERIVHLALSPADDPPDSEQFSLWVLQSINQSAQAIVRHVVSDLTNAGRHGSMLCTGSSFVAQLLAAHPQARTDLNTDLAQIALQLEVPVLSSVNIEDLMRIRTDQGEAFRNFRVALQRQVRDLRGIQDRVELARRLENVSQELTESQVHDVRTAVSRLKRELVLEGLVAAASLAAAFPTSGASLFGLVAAGAPALTTIARYWEEVKAHPAYFLWCLQKRAR